jgi:hypothetical protein
VTIPERHLGFIERVAVDLFALALMVHSTVVAFRGSLRIPDALAVTLAVGLMRSRH